MSEPLAYFLTWTTYGTWLHGDVRGSVDRHNACPGIDYHEPRPAWEAASRDRMDSAPVILSPRARALVDQAIRQHADFRGWGVLAMNCRSNHVHAVLTAGGVAPKRVMTELKAYATRALRQAGEAVPQKTWTRHGSTRYVWTEASLQAAIRYVEEQ